MVTCRPCWRNCALEPDDEIRAIDAMEDKLPPFDEGALAVRELISSLELCHHKAKRWVANIVGAIGALDTGKGLGTRAQGATHPKEEVWQQACAALQAWLAGESPTSVDIDVGGVAASKLLAGLGDPTPLKVWQVERVIERIRSLVGFPWSAEDPDHAYTFLLLGGTPYEVEVQDRCPPRFAEDSDLWLATARTLLEDRDHDKPAVLSLAFAIDMLWPCHWRFVDNLELVLDAIGGQLELATPFAACGRNIELHPARSRLEEVESTLQAFVAGPVDDDVDQELLARLGEPDPTRRWLAASLDKTMRLQLDPPPALHVTSSLVAPDWLRSEGRAPD